MACEATIAVTLVGDPWQALYGFRGARPDIIPALLTEQGFESLQLTESFRFQSDQMRDLGDALRAGHPVTLGTGDDYNVLIASKWDDLWSGPTNVLPLSFGRTTNKTDAAAIVLLDHLVYANFQRRAIFLPEALILLGLDQETYQRDGPEVLAGVIDTLRRPGDGSVGQALFELRNAMKILGAPRRPRAGSGDADDRQLARLNALRERVQSSELLVPGMTIHQAKGKEWDRVGVRLNEAQLQRLNGGLNQATEGDRAVYVALTRARFDVRFVAGL
jgi:DNA helicase II / ATP-dependent DNA helicase PcrA